MAAAGPRRQQQQQPRVGGSDHLVPLPGSELHQQPDAPAHALALGGRDLDLAVEYDEPRALVNLMVGEALASREVEHDRPCHIARGKDLRQPRLQIERLQIPAVHDHSLRSVGPIELSFHGRLTRSPLGPGLAPLSIAGAARSWLSGSSPSPAARLASTYTRSEARFTNAISVALTVIPPSRAATRRRSARRRKVRARSSAADAGVAPGTTNAKRSGCSASSRSIVCSSAAVIPAVTVDVRGTSLSRARGLAAASAAATNRPRCRSSTIA